MIYLYSSSAHVVAMWQEKLEGLSRNEGEFSRLKAHLRQLKEGTQAVVLVDLQNCEVPSSRIVFELTSLPGVAVAALTGVPKFEEGMMLLQAGVKGYANTYLDPVHLASMVDMIEQGNTWVYPEFMQQLVARAAVEPPPPTGEASSRLAQLTPKEREVAVEVAKGASNKDIAVTLGITERTVKAHMSAIFAKLEIGDRLSLALLMGPNV